MKNFIMIKKISILFLVATVVFLQIPVAFAQLDTTSPDMAAPAPTEPAPETTTPESEPVMETVTPTDTTPPVISGVMQASVMPTSASFVWSTDELATSTFKYGTTESYGQTATLDASQMTMHTATIAGLTPATLYYYCITATDSSNNTSSSCGHSFTTEAEETPADTNPPTITSVSVSDITENSADISWTTDEVADGYVEFGTTPSYGSQTSLVTDYTTDHTATLSGLVPDTEYFYRVVSSDGVGNTTRSTENNFTTLTAASEPAPEPTPEPEPTPDSSTGPEPSAEPASVEPAVISGVEVTNVTADSATITWITDVPADSQVNYGDSSALGTLTVLDATLKTNHSVTITGLAENTAYYFETISKPAGTTVKTTSALHDFTTLEVPQETVAPAEITNITQGAITTTSANISVTTNKATSSYVKYGTSTEYGTLTPTNASNTNHEFDISNLTPNTIYHYRVVVTDEAGNITYSENFSFTTPEESNSQTGGETSTTTPSEPAVEPAPTPAPETTVSIIDAPILIEAVGVDNQNFFVWKNPNEPTLAGTVLIRKAGGYPTLPTDGKVIHNSKAETFTDLNVQNDNTYYYALYSYDENGVYSKPVHIKLTPIAIYKQKVLPVAVGSGGLVESNESFVVESTNNGVEKPIVNIPILKAPVIVEKSPAEHFVDELSKGGRGVEVRHLQRLLEADGHFSTVNPIDGIFGSETLKALQSFQTTYNLPQTGATTPLTREKLNAISQNEVVLSIPDDITLFNTSLKIGSKGEDVKMLQKFLVHEGSLQSSLLDGKYGPNTKQGVTNFQIKHNVKPIDGHFGPITRHRAEVISGL
jgi:peptidoglycan hydrolase-like protein with peptidoglycan-binding domain